MARKTDLIRFCAIVTFERGERITARFTFELISPVNNNSDDDNMKINQKEKKIKSLRIQFTN